MGFPPKLREVLRYTYSCISSKFQLSRILTKFTPLQCQLVKFSICDEFLGTKLSKLSEKEKSWTPEGVPTKARVPSKICTGNYGNNG